MHHLSKMRNRFVPMTINIIDAIKTYTLMIKQNNFKILDHPIILQQTN